MIGRKSIFFLFVVCMVAMSAQSVSYTLTPSRELGLFSAGVSFNALGYIQSRNTSVLKLEDIHKLDRLQLDALDRTATYNYSVSARKTSDGLLLGSLFLPSVLMVDAKQHSQLGEKGVILAQTYLINAGTTLLVKSLVKRTRPFVYNPHAPLSEKLKPDARMSFYSGHTSFTASSAFLTASILTSNGQNKEMAPMIWSGAAALPAIQGYLRWKAGKHFPTDIFIGYAVGAALGYFIPKIHEGF